MKTNVSIKFNSIEEYREIERVLEELGYVNDKEWNDFMIRDFGKRIDLCVDIYSDLEFNIHVDINSEYNSLKEFLKD